MPNDLAPLPNPTLPAIEERQIDGNYGEIFHNGHFQADLRDFSGRLAIERREIPRAATNTMVYRRGRITRDGSVRIGKVDSRWENVFVQYANMSAEEKRQRRAAGIPIIVDSQLLIKLDDPESWGAEEMVLFGVKFWEVGIGFTMDTLTERDIPVTWQAEAIPKAIPRPGNHQGAAGQLPAGEQTWGNIDRAPGDLVV